MTGWNVAYVKTQKEFGIQRDLAEKGIEAYAPARKLLRRPRHLRGKVVSVTVPLYRSYVFFRPLSDDQINHVLNHRDVVGVVRFGDHYASIREKAMARLRAMIEEGVFDEEEVVVTKTAPQPKQGDILLVTKGLFEGEVATFLRPSGDKALVVLTAEGKEINVTLPWDQVE